VLLQPVSWFHEVFYADGMPYRQREVDTIRSLTALAGSSARTVEP
jgi:hypothetical protein